MGEWTEGGHVKRGLMWPPSFFKEIVVKKIEAIIKPYKLEAVKNGLAEIGCEGITLSEVKGFGRQKGQSESFRGHEYIIAFMPKLKLELVVPDSLVSLALEVIIKHAKTGKIGDGKIFITPVDQAIRIRTGDSGAIAV